MCTFLKKKKTHIKKNSGFIQSNPLALVQDPALHIVNTLETVKGGNVCEGVTYHSEIVEIL